MSLELSGGRSVKQLELGQIFICRAQDPELKDLEMQTPLSLPFWAFHGTHMHDTLSEERSHKSVAFLHDQCR